MAGCCSLSRQTLRHLKLNTPHWLLIVGLRLATAVIASLTIAAFVVCISDPASTVANGGSTGNSSAWQWGDLWMECFAFVAPAVSLLQTLVTIPYLLSTTHLIQPVIELLIELTIVLVAAFPIVFCATVSGPLQQWQNPHSDTARLEVPGIMELIGFIGLCLLEVFHFGFFIWACCRAHRRRRENIMRSRAAAMKLEAGWGMNGEEEDMGHAEVMPRDETPEPRAESRQRTDDDILTPLGGAGLGLAARKESQQTEHLNNARLPSTVSALSAWDGELSLDGRRPSSLELMPQSRRPTEPSQIGVAIGKPHEIWVPITELRSESPFSTHRIVDDHEVVIVGDGEVKVVSTPREEVFMGFKLPEPSTPVLNKERSDYTEDGFARQSADPDVPQPLNVRKSMQRMRSFRLGNSWGIEEAKSRATVVDQGW